MSQSSVSPGTSSRASAPTTEIASRGWLAVRRSKHGGGALQKTRKTSVGVPLPDYVQYKPGICPKAEASLMGATGFGVHHAMTHDDVRKQVEDMKKRLDAM